MNNMNHCRICQTEFNLKYVPEELEKRYKKRNKDAVEEDENPATRGNICLRCDEKVLNLHKQDDDIDLEADSGGEETHVYVDDDLWFYKEYCDKVHNLPSQDNEKHLQHVRQQNSLSSNCDTETVEILSSRESTPSLKVKNEKVMPVIILSDDENTNLTPENVAMCKIQLTNKLPICKREKAINTFPIYHNNNNLKFDSHITNKIAATTPIKKHKTHYDHNKLIVLAKLNLISSDSEQDESFPCGNRNSSYLTRQITEKQNELIVKKETVDKNQKDLLQKSLKNNETTETVRDRVKCPVLSCQLVFSCNQRLVHHMRIRHRSNELDTQLRERVRHSQDSALTIRLCYKGRYLYYECQMCGRIDCIFKDHKEHAIAKHSAELISLKDPLLKSLHCPLCHHDCGGFHIDLCRHLLENHALAQSKLYIKEVKSGGPKLKKVANTARVYRFEKSGNYYFQCRQCKQISCNLNSHRKHITAKHSQKLETKYVKEKENNTRKDVVTLPVKNDRKLRNKKQEQNKVKEIPKNINHKKVIVETQKKHPKAENNGETGTAIGKHKLKTITKSKSKIPPGNKTAPVKENKLQKIIKANGKDKTIVPPQTKRRRSRRSATENLVRVRVKVKQPIIQVPIQSYHCQHCNLFLKGFLIWNLHNLKEHSEEEFHKCSICNKLFLDNLNLQKHLNTHKVVALNMQHRRKYVEGTCLTIDENSNATKANCCKENPKQLITNNDTMQERTIEEQKDTNDKMEENMPIWLQEIINKKKLAEKREKTDTKIMMNLTNSGELEIKPNTAILE